MRYALAAAGPAIAQTGANASFSFREIPCRYYANPKSYPTSDIVELMPQIGAGVDERRQP